jgi:hypothetical protein
VVKRRSEPQGIDNLQSVPRRALMGRAWHHPHALEARPLVGPLFTAQPRRGACHALSGFLNGDCMVDVRLDTLPLGRPWSRIGPNLFCTDCGAPGAMNIVPNWLDMPSRSAPFRKGWTR